MLRVKGNKIIENNIEFQIKGISLIDVGEIKEYIRRKIDLAMKFWNINTIRLPVYPPVIPNRISTYPYKRGNYLIESVILPTIEYADAFDLKAIIDWHQIAPLTDQTIDSALEFWEDITGSTSSYDNVIYEVYNEPVNGNQLPVWESTAKESWDLCRPHLHRLVSDIRQMTDKLIICPTPVYCRLPLGASLEPIDVDNVAYSAHIYPPDVWFNEGLAGFGDILSPMIDFSFGIFKQIKECENIPIVITEVGLTDNKDFTKEFVSLLSSINVGYVAWVLDSLWWPPLLTENNIPSKFGKEIKRLMA